MRFVKAERKAVKLKLALAGISGAGKTMGSLLVASGLVGKGGKIAVIDTENGRSNLYSDHSLTKGIEFDVLELQAPYTVTKYLAALNAAIEGGYDVVIMDSISHEWDGAGGILDQKNVVDSRGGNSFTNWGKFTPEHNKFLSAIISANIHVICTMRNKTDVVVESNEKGKQVPRKVGLKAVQREGVEYEFDTIFDIDIGHTFSVNKDRTGLFDGRIEVLTEKIGKELRDWLSTGAMPVTTPNYGDVDFTDTNPYSTLTAEIDAICANDDKSAIVDLWSDLTKPQKEAIWPQLNEYTRSWAKPILKGAPQMA